MDLLLAVTAAVLVMAAVVMGDPYYVAAICLVGAVSFFAGFIESLGAAALLAGWAAFRMVASRHGMGLSGVMMQVFGYGCVAWLGYRHREQQRIQRERSERQAHADSVIPWVVTNEVRNSLAAIRFLLFPLHDGPEPADERQPLRQVTDELQRLENLFSDIERSNQEPAQGRRAGAADGRQRTGFERSSGRV